MANYNSIFKFIKLITIYITNVNFLAKQKEFTGKLSLYINDYIYNLIFVI